MKVRIPFLLLISSLLSAGVEPICHGDTIVTCIGQRLSFFPTDIPKNVQVVDLSENNITNLNASDLEKYPRITSLLLDHNKISTSYNLRGISQLKELRELHISSNGVSLIDFKVFDNLHLESIIANNNSNLQIADNAVDLPNIRNISFENCQLSEFPLTALSKFGGLESLHLRWNNIPTLPGNLTTFFPKLKELWISNNPLSSIDPELCHVVDVTTHPNCTFETKPVRQSLSGNTPASPLGVEKNIFEGVEPTTEKISTTTTVAVTESEQAKGKVSYVLVVLFVILLVTVGCPLIYYIKHFYCSRRKSERPHFTSIRHSEYHNGALNNNNSILFNERVMSVITHEDEW